MCTAVEKIDETQFWFELIAEAKRIEASIFFAELKNEIDELVKIGTTSKANMKKE